jgi:hypothetical protein
MTAKGFATRAAKQLLDHAITKDVTILAAHDADISGYEIARTLERETRTTRGMHIDVIDLGLTVEEALSMGLEAESVVIQKAPSYELLYNLTPQEKEFFLCAPRIYGGRQGKRVELNAMTTDQLVCWIEEKLGILGLKSKVLPPESAVQSVLRSAIKERLADDIKQMLKGAIEELFGLSFVDMEREIATTMGEPKLDDYYSELKQFLHGCPPQYWRDWICNKADEIEGAHVKNKRLMVHNTLRQWLNTKVQRG